MGGVSGTRLAHELTCKGGDLSIINKRKEYKPFAEQ